MSKMFVNDCLNINSSGHLTIGGCDTVELAKKYGTPLYVLDENVIRENCRSYVRSFKKFYNGNGMPLYASKALSCKELCRIVNEEHMGLDVVSGGEIYTAVQAGFPMEKVHFHGNNKTDADIAYAMDCGVGTFVVDNDEELEAISYIATQRRRKQPILLRITPGIDPHTHKAVVTGSVDSKFGQAIATGQAFSFTEKALSLPGLVLKGFHCHIGSQIFESEPFCQAASIMLHFIADVRRRFGYTAEQLNLGGGFGVRYVESQPSIDIAASIRQVAAQVKRCCQELALPFPAILMEPGRSLVADTVTTLYTVGSVKEIPGVKNYISVDGGMTDNPRYALYGSEYTLLNATKAAEEADFICSVGGRCCESGDLIQENVALARPTRGDILAVFTTGAYNYAMASNYNRIPRPAILLLDKEKEILAVRRETYEDLCRCDMPLT